jgi:hypothetical protein
VNIKRGYLSGCNAVFLSPHMPLSKQVEATLIEEPELLFRSEMEVSSSGEFYIVAYFKSSRFHEETSIESLNKASAKSMQKSKRGLRWISLTSAGEYVGDGNLRNVSGATPLRHGNITDLELR